MDELLKKWSEYTDYLAAHDEVPETYGRGYYNFYWFMLWCHNGSLPGKKFAPITNSSVES